MANAANVIIDTGCANLSSVLFAITRLGYQATITDDIEQIKAADKVILPGVGNAKHAMNNIAHKGLTSTIQQLTQPVLGFCLGMQLMCKDSLEADAASSVANEQPASKHEVIDCLNLIPTSVQPLKANGLRLPHMGWNTLADIIEHPVFEGIKTGDYFYFVHSFAAPINEHTAASCDYGSKFSAAICKDNFIGCQFHPERSGKNGSKIIANFLEVSSC